MNVIQALNDNYKVKSPSFTFFAIFQAVIKRFLLVMKKKSLLRALTKNGPDNPRNREQLIFLGLSECTFY